MERSETLIVLGRPRVFGMPAADDEIVAVAMKRQHEPQQIIGDLLTAEFSEKPARSIKYRLTIPRRSLKAESPSISAASTS